MVHQQDVLILAKILKFTYILLHMTGIHLTAKMDQFILLIFYFTNHNGLQIILLIMWQNSMIKASLIGISHTIL